ncbi:hypothetical protein Hanom_Chr00s000204g01627921 [Helianthus anomalus]
MGFFKTSLNSYYSNFHITFFTKEKENNIKRTCYGSDSGKHTYFQVIRLNIT